MTNHKMFKPTLIILFIIALLIGTAALTSACHAAPAEEETVSEIDWRCPDAGCYVIFATVESSEHGTTRFITRDGNIFTVNDEHDPNVPYLLTVYGNYTDDVTDDEVCVVWAAVEGAHG